MERKVIVFTFLLAVVLMGNFVNALQVTGRFVIEGDETIEETVVGQSGSPVENFPTGRFVATDPMSEENQIVVIAIIIVVLVAVYFLVLRKK